MRQVASEVLKVRTIRAWLWIALGTFGLVALTTISVVATEASHVLATLDEQRQVIRFAAIADVFALLLGIVILGGELSRGTITQTFLVEPVRERVMAAKALVAALLGALLATASVALVLVIAVPWLAADGIDLSLEDGHLQRIILGTVLAGALGSGLGVGWAALFRGQGSALAAGLVYLLIVENVLGAVFDEQREYLPGAAFAAVANAATERTSSSDLLAIWPGFLLSLGYTAAFLLVGTLILRRRDL